MQFFRRPPALFLILGLTVKGLLILIWRFNPAPELFELLISYDPAAFAFAEKGVALLFDPRRIAPTPAESLVFEILLALGFGLECMLIAFLCQMLVRSKGTRRIARQSPGR